MNRALRRIALVAVVALIIQGSSCRDEAARWELVWSDEFDGPAGQSPDPNKWGYDIGTGNGGWGNAQLEYDTDRPENVSLDGNGNLAITAREEQFGGNEYTSARIHTFQKFEHTRGLFEARIKLPIGQGIWPAFWLLGADFPVVGWPECGEIDIMEYRGQHPTVAIGSLHGPGYSGGGAVSNLTRLQQGNFNDDFHVFAVEWERDQVTWLLDGVRYSRVKRTDLPSGGRWVYNHPFFIILNVAVGGHFVGSPDETTQFPQTMLVDWVRVSAWSDDS